MNNRMRYQLFCDLDADGISACTLAYSYLSKQGKVIVTPVPGPDTDLLRIKKMPADEYYFLDVGATIMGFIESYFGRKAIVIDHHHGPSGNWYVKDYVNPTLEGKDSLLYASTSSLVYEYFGFDDDLSAFLALVGAAGDIEDVDGKFHGLNKKILRESSLRMEESFKAPGKSFVPLALVVDMNMFPAVNLDFEGICRALGKHAFSIYYDVKESVDGLLKKMYGSEWKVAFNPHVSYNGEEIHDVALLMSGFPEDELLSRIKRLLNGEFNFYQEKIKILELYTKFEKYVSEMKVKEYDSGISVLVLPKGTEFSLGIFSNYLVKKKGANLAVVCREAGDYVLCSLKSYNHEVNKIAEIAASLVGGRGGGHKVAAGAKVPKHMFSKFIESIVLIVKSLK